MSQCHFQNLLLWHRKQREISVRKHSIEKHITITTLRNELNAPHFIHCCLPFQSKSSHAFVNTADSMECRLVEISCYFKHGFGCQDFRNDTASQNSPRIDDHSKLMIMVSFQFEREYSTNEIKINDSLPMILLKLQITAVAFFLATLYNT